MASAAKVGREGIKVMTSAFKKWQRNKAQKQADEKRQQAHKQRVASEPKEGTERGRFKRGSHPSRSRVEGARLDPTTEGSVDTARTLEKRIRAGQEKVATGSRTRIERVTPEVAPTSGEIQRVLNKKARGSKLSKKEQRIHRLIMKSGKESDEGKFVYKGREYNIGLRQRAQRKGAQPAYSQINAQEQIDKLEKKIRNNQKMSDSDWNKYNRLHKTINETPSKKDAIHALTQYGEILPGFDPTEKQVKSALTNLKARGMNKKLREMVAVAEQMGMTGLVTFKGSRGVPGTVARNIEPKPGTPRRKRLTGKQAEKKAIARKRGPAQGRQLTRASGQKKQGREVGIRSEDRKIGGTVMKKKHGGMTHVGLSPAEMSRSGTMSEAKRARYMQKGGYLKDIKPNTTWEQFKKKHPDVGITKKGFEGLKPPANLKWKKGPKYRRTYQGLEPIEREAKHGGPIHTTFPRRADPRTEGRAPAVDLFPEVGRKKSGKVGNKKQGYKARKDESIAQRVKKKRTKKQLTASRRESYGKWGTGKGKGKINRISSKQTDGNKVIAAIYG